MTLQPFISAPGAARALAEEVPVALVYQGTTQAVMMASPCDLEDFAVGFSVSEGIVASPAEIEELDIQAVDDGHMINMWLDAAPAERLAQRRRRLAGPVGCGLCGIDSIAEAIRPAEPVRADGLRLTQRQMQAAAAALRRVQTLHDATGAAHGAGLWRPDAGLVRVREDVGRHNALDKLIGASVHAGETGEGAAIVLTSRVSVELVQKAASFGAEAVLALSAPTALAVREAERAGLTLVTNLKTGAQVRCHPGRLHAPVTVLGSEEQ